MVFWKFGFFAKVRNHVVAAAPRHRGVCGRAKRPCSKPVCGLRPVEGPRRPPMAPQIAHKHHREHGKLALGLWGSCYQYMRSTECPLGIRVSERRPLGSGRSRTPAFGCVGRSRSAVPPPQPQSRARVLFLAARTQKKPRTPNVPRGAAGRRLPTEAHRRTECCCQCEPPACSWPEHHRRGPFCSAGGACVLVGARS